MAWCDWAGCYVVQHKPWHCLRKQVLSCCPATYSDCPHNTVPPCCPATCSDTGATNACMPAVGELRRLECCNLSFTGVYCEHTNGC